LEFYGACARNIEWQIPILQRYGQRLIKTTDRTLDVGERACSTATTYNCFGLLLQGFVNVIRMNL